MDENIRIQARVGEGLGSDGTAIDLRLAKNGSLVTAEGQGKYYEETSRGHVYSFTLVAGTTAISAGNLINAAAAASTQFAIWNPTGSGKNLSLLKFGVWVISGTSPISGLFHSFSSTAPTIVSSGVSLPVCNNVGRAYDGVAKYLSHASGANLTGSTALLTIRAADIFFSAGTFAALGGQRAIEYIDGDIVVPPGTAWVPTWQAAGTSMLVGYSITWAEKNIS